MISLHLCVTLSCLKMNDRFHHLSYKNEQFLSLFVCFFKESFILKPISLKSFILFISAFPRPLSLTAKHGYMIRRCRPYLFSAKAKRSRLETSLFDQLFLHDLRNSDYSRQVKIIKSFHQPSLSTWKLPSGAHFFSSWIAGDGWLLAGTPKA